MIIAILANYEKEATYLPLRYFVRTPLPEGGRY